MCAWAAASVAELEHVAEPPTASAPPAAVLVPRVIVIPVVVAVIVGPLAPERCDIGLLAVEDLVELAAVQPHATAAGAIVDLHAVALGKPELALVDGALHHIGSAGRRLAPRGQ